MIDQNIRRIQNLFSMVPYKNLHAPWYKCCAHVAYSSSSLPNRNAFEVNAAQLLPNKICGSRKRRTPVYGLRWKVVPTCAVLPKARFSVKNDGPPKLSARSLFTEIFYSALSESVIKNLSGSAYPLRIVRIRPTRTPDPLLTG